MTKRVYPVRPSKLTGREKVFDHRAAIAAANVLGNVFDMRKKMPAVTDQGSEGDCTGHAAVAAGTVGTETTTDVFSPQYQYWYERENEVQTGENANALSEDCGATGLDIIAAAKGHGFCPETDDPYISGDYKTAPTKAQDEAAQHIVTEGELVKGIVGIKTACQLTGKVVMIGIPVYSSFESDTVAKSGIVPMPKIGEKELGGHEVDAIGWTDLVNGKMQPLDGFTTPEHHKIFGELFSSHGVSGYCLMRNSWGASWGVGGYFLLPYEYITKYAFECWIFDFAPIKSGK